MNFYEAVRLMEKEGGMIYSPSIKFNKSRLHKNYLSFNSKGVLYVYELYSFNKNCTLWNTGFPFLINKGDVISVGWIHCSTFKDSYGKYPGFCLIGEIGKPE